MNRSINVALPAPAEKPSDNEDRIRALLADLRIAFPAPTLSRVPLRTVLRCDCHGVHEVTLIVDGALLPAIPVRAESLPVHCFAFRAAINHYIRRVAEHMLDHATVLT